MAALASATTVVNVGDGEDPEVFTKIAGVNEINGVNLERLFEDSTSFDSLGWEEVIPTLKKMGNPKLKVNFNPGESTHNYTTGLTKAWDDGELKNYQIVFPDPAQTTWTVPAYVKNVGELKMSAKGKLEGGFELQPSGKPTLA